MIDDEQIARSTETIQSKGIPDEIETDNSDTLEILPRNDVPVLANSVDNLVSEHSKESNEKRTSTSDSAVPPSTSSSPSPSTLLNAEVGIIAENEAENHRTVDPSPNELSSSSTTSSDGPAPIEIPYVFCFLLFFLELCYFFFFISLFLYCYLMRRTVWVRIVENVSIVIFLCHVIVYCLAIYVLYVMYTFHINVYSSRKNVERAKCDLII